MALKRSRTQNHRSMQFCFFGQSSCPVVFLFLLPTGALSCSHHTRQPYLFPIGALSLSFPPVELAFPSHRLSPPLPPLCSHQRRQPRLQKAAEVGSFPSCGGNPAVRAAIEVLTGCWCAWRWHRAPFAVVGVCCFRTGSWLGAVELTMAQ